jgi:hypothetical protein
MSELNCAFCGIEINNNDVAYGLTKGTVDDECYGFRMDSDSDWDVYCPDCMNEIDKLLSDFKRTRTP